MTITNQKCACNERIFYDRFGALYIGPTIRYTCCKHYIECSGKLKHVYIDMHYNCMR